MTIQIKTYKDMAEYRSDTSMSGFRALHQDFDPRGFKVTWVNGSDDPGNTPRTLRTMTETNFIKEIAERQGVRII